jgi:hypothetical protein
MWKSGQQRTWMTMGTFSTGLWANLRLNEPSPMRLARHRKPGCRITGFSAKWLLHVAKRMRYRFSLVDKSPVHSPTILADQPESMDVPLPRMPAAWRPFVCARRIRSPFAVRSSFVCLIWIMRRTQDAQATLDQQIKVVILFRPAQPRRQP